MPPSRSPYCYHGLYSQWAWGDADADFGYVGSKAGKIDLYVGKKCVEKNIDFQDADERLIALIQSCGKWVDPVVC